MPIETDRTKVQNLLQAMNTRSQTRDGRLITETNDPDALFRSDRNVFTTIEANDLLVAFSVEKELAGDDFLRWSMATSSIKPDANVVAQVLNEGRTEAFRLYGSMPIQVILSDRCPWISEFPDNDLDIVDICLAGFRQVIPRGSVKLDPPEKIVIYGKNECTDFGLVYAHTTPLKVSHDIVQEPWPDEPFEPDLTELPTSPKNPFTNP